MRYHVLACDFDGTLAEDGHVPEPVLEALGRVRASGRALILVTGRVFDELAFTFPQLDLFDLLVIENGAVLAWPETREQQPLARPVPPEFVQELIARGVKPLTTGHVVAATWHPHETTIVRAIFDLGLDLHLSFNKGAVMVLPSGVNKASGLAAALNALGYSPRNTIAVGDAENDLCMFDLVECGVAVANAVPAVLERADHVVSLDHGAGVIEVIECLLRDDGVSVEPAPGRHDLRFGHVRESDEYVIGIRGGALMLAGESASGKSTIAAGLVGALQQHGYQVCVLDPEGDYIPVGGAIALGDGERVPDIAAICDLLANPGQSVVVNLLGMSLDQRPGYFAALVEAINVLRSAKGRPHWLVVDEAHHVLPAWQPNVPANIAVDGTRTVLITVDPSHVHPAVAPAVSELIATGRSAAQTLARFCTWAGHPQPALDDLVLAPRDVLVWNLQRDDTVHVVTPALPGGGHRRHRRKYAEGDLGPWRSFYFRGPLAQYNLPARNLSEFLEIAQRIDPQTWLYHLQRHDYSRWMREVIRDRDCAAALERIESNTELSAPASLALVQAEIERRYTSPA
ncbi:MAG: phosphoglycolate phosphatase [Chloroflexi bacterium]|nr:MAG: phosphoglycolate phosphatase [Chloroflexota bacterium]